MAGTPDAYRLAIATGRHPWGHRVGFRKGSRGTISSIHQRVCSTEPPPVTGFVQIHALWLGRSPGGDVQGVRVPMAVDDAPGAGGPSFENSPRVSRSPSASVSTAKGITSVVFQPSFEPQKQVDRNQSGKRGTTPVVSSDGITMNIKPDLGKSSVFHV